MVWRVPRGRFDQQKGAGNRRALRALVEQAPPGILAYAGKTAVGWCAVAPREQYPVLGRSRLFPPSGEEAVWSISCLFIARSNRGRGLSSELARAAAAYAFSQGARVVEGYPYEPGKRTAPAFVWTGLVSSFERAGFHEAARPSRTRRLMRLLPLPHGHVDNDCGNTPPGHRV
jgi:GNAT superfamily N-acetyltransferase